MNRSSVSRSLRTTAGARREPAHQEGLQMTAVSGSGPPGLPDASSRLGHWAEISPLLAQQGSLIFPFQVRRASPTPKPRSQRLRPALAATASRRVRTAPASDPGELPAAPCPASHAVSPAARRPRRGGEARYVLESESLKDGRQGQLERLAQGDGGVKEAGPDQESHRFLGRGVACRDRRTR